MAATEALRRGLLSYWLSHVPPSHFDGFWQVVHQALRPGGRVFFIDTASPTLAAADHVVQDDPERSVSLRRLSDGRQYNIVKVFWQREALRQRLGALGFDMSVRHTKRGYCIYGHGRRQQH